MAVMLPQPGAQPRGNTSLTGAADQAVEDPVQEPFELGAKLRGGRAALRHRGGEPGVPPGAEQFR